MTLHDNSYKQILLNKKLFEKSTKVSIIIPARNEEENVEPLLTRIVNSLAWTNIEYEIIIIDDYSTDGTYKILRSLQSSFPLKVFKKKGSIGKGTSILEGIRHASGNVIAVLDADLAYPPESLHYLIDKLESSDIVVGDRIYVNGERMIKKILSLGFKYIFGKMVFGLNLDIQSGLKIFKKDIINHIDLHPSNWSFDLEFLLKATHAGYKITDFPIPYGSRKKGEGKMNLFSATIELVWLSIYYRINPFKPVVIDNKDKSCPQIGYQNNRFNPYTNLKLHDSAIVTIMGNQKIWLLGILASSILLFKFNWHIFLIVIITLISLIYFSDLLFYIFLIVKSLRTNPSVTIRKDDIEKRNEWPKYTIISPLYKEASVIPQFIKSIDNLDYPKDKLQVILALESDDKETIEAVKNINLPNYYQPLIVPHNLPKTKPKACNYALRKARGEYIVVYDAEDIPAPDQLKKAVMAFENSLEENVICLQAKLDFYNPRQNLLTRLFALEYALWFNLILTGLHAIDAPIPLGGTSNHFKRKYLNLLQGWDPFNVTEDCDLGIRLFKYGYKTKILESITNEEANSDFFGWFRQRSRWIKGYIQTYLVHMRNPHEFITDLSNPHLLTFQLIVGGKILAMWINPFLWIMTFIYFAFRHQTGAFIESLYLTPIFYFAVFALVIGNFFYLYNYMIAAAKKEAWDMIKLAYLVPVYWLMMSIGSWIALNQLIFKPHFWEKTKHGLHLDQDISVNLFIPKKAYG